MPGQRLPPGRLLLGWLIAPLVPPILFVGDTLAVRHAPMPVWHAHDLLGLAVMVAMFAYPIPWCGGAAIVLALRAAGANAIGWYMASAFVTAMAIWDWLFDQRPYLGTIALRTTWALSPSAPERWARRRRSAGG